MTIFNDDSKSYVLKQIESIKESSRFMFQLLQKEELSEDFKDTVLSLNEQQLYNIAKKLKLSSPIIKEIDKYSKPIKKSHRELKALQKKVQETFDFSNYKEDINKLFEIINHYWYISGFTSASDININDYGYLEFKLNVNLDYDYEDMDNTIKRKDIDTLIKDGFNIKEIYNDHYKCIDCEQNRDLLKSMILKRLPSSTIYKWNNFYDNRNQFYYLTDIVVQVELINDIIEFNNHYKVEVL